MSANERKIHDVIAFGWSLKQSVDRFVVWWFVGRSVDRSIVHTFDLLVARLVCPFVARLEDQ